MQSLQGKTALITGAGKGLGKSMALALAAEGVHLGLIARTEADLVLVKEAALKINPGIKVALHTADVSEYEQVQTAIKSITDELQAVNILINNAGILKVGSFKDTPIKEWEQVIKTNVFGAYYTIMETLPHLLAQNSGDVINIGSTAGLKGNANLSAYGASKAAVNNLSEALMQELRKSNIRVSTVNPSTIATEMTMNANFTDGNEEKVLQPEDLAQLVVDHLKLPQRALVKDFSLWSTNP
ncbi:MAG: 3-ketoacyl-ACP reductase [Bacteroidetes bacterium 43-16]|nr:MAG: 3-ketoacyl-ACP reductase [Bacteroidetes bacterium 43-16]